jgi:enamine deaminase RidA (YjgF/YER057c/UK114 family)
VPLGADVKMVFVSGQVASDDQGNTIGVGDPARQTEVVIGNLEAVLRAAGGSLANLVSVVIYLRNITDFPAVSAVRNRLFGEPAPSSTLVEVSRLAIADHLVEISGVAVIHGAQPSS